MYFQFVELLFLNVVFLLPTAVFCLLFVAGVLFRLFRLFRFLSASRTCESKAAREFTEQNINNDLLQLWDHRHLVDGHKLDRSFGAEIAVGFRKVDLVQKQVLVRI